MQKLATKSRHIAAYFSNANRDARYVITLIWSLALFGLMLLQAVNAGWFDSIEKPVFMYFNDLPHWLSGIMYLMTQFGSLGGLLIWLPVAWYLINKRAAYTVFLGGFSAWIIAKVFKNAVGRGRPQAFLDNVHLYHNHAYTGFGFPSGHSTFSAACATVLYYQVRPKYRKYLVAVVLLVGISRMYLGAHFPLDVVGGWALGITAGSMAVLAMGTSAKQLSATTIKRVLKRKGYDIKSAQFVSVDARGSRPMVIELADGNVYFGKIFGEQEHAADWLFKIYRFFRYKNLQAEEPYLNGRRNIELESFANLWAKDAGVRSPAVIDIIKIGRNWLLIQQKIAAQPLPDFKRIKTSSLEDAWRQVTKLHKANMAHRDLRAANLMIDKSGAVWIIDYGFAEVSPNASRTYMDVAELLMSMSLVVGVERTVESALKIVDHDKLRRSLTYLHRSVFSGATNQLLKKNKQLLKDLQESLKKELRVKGEVEEPNIDRLNGKKLLMIVFFAVFVYVVLPQFGQFRAAFNSLDNIRLLWVVPVILLSVLTYIAAGAVYVALATVPLKLRQATLVQLAASFMSKIIPGGLGSTGLNVRYLSKEGLDAVESSALIIAQNLIGVIMFIGPLVLFLLINGQSVGSLFSVHIQPKIIFAILVVILIAGITGFVNSSLRTRAKSFMAKFISQLRDVSSSPRELSLAALASFAITLSYVGCLYASIHAFHATLSFGAAIVIYATAMIAKTAVPTPGGLGPVEVAMSAAMIGLGIPSGQAFAIVVLYRLATFWLPIPFSVLAYRYISSKNII